MPRSEQAKKTDHVSVGPESLGRKRPSKAITPRSLKNIEEEEAGLAQEEVPSYEGYMLGLFFFYLAC